MAVIGNSPGVASQRVTTTFTATAGQTTFTPVSGYTLGYCDVYQNGVKLVSGDDYTAADGVSVVLGTGAAAGDAVEVVAHFPRGLSDGYTKAEADARYDATGTAAALVDDLSGVTNAATARTNLGLSNVENKSSATIRSEITSGNVTTGLGYTPVNKAGDTMTGTLGITKTGVAERARLSSLSSGSVMNAGQINDVYVLNAPFGDNASSVSNNSAKWGIRFTGHNEDAQLDTTGKSACIYAVSEDPGAGYNRAVGLAFHTTSFDSTHREQMRIDNLGRVTMPYQPVFCVGSMTSPNNGNWYNGTQTANRGGWSYNSSSGTITVPSGLSGLFLIHAHMLYNTANSYAQMILRINGAFVDEAFVNTGSNALCTAGFTHIRSLAGGDTINVNNTAGGWYSVATGNVILVQFLG